LTFGCRQPPLDRPLLVGRRFAVAQVRQGDDPDFEPPSIWQMSV
jgi:hypothetical protein